MKHTEYERNELVGMQAEQANYNANRAYSWLKGIKLKEAQRLGLADMVERALNLLLTVDTITTDIIKVIEKLKIEKLEK